jgi:hypothetical protein
MAWDPCVSCGKSFHGSTQFTYVTWHQGETRFAYRLRECVECATERHSHCQQVGDQRDAENNWQRSPYVESTNIRAIKGA